MKSKAAATAPRRRWLKRLLWSLLGLGLALVIFHRPILRFALQRGAPAFARGSGLEISWEVGGTVLGGVDLTNVTITGDSTAPVQKLTAARIRADYGLWDLMKKGVGQFTNEVTVQDADLVLDTTKFLKQKKDDDPAPPQVTFPRVRLENVNARIILADGEVMVRGLNFSMEPGGSGVFEFAELQLPNGLPPLHDVKGTTVAETAKLTLQALSLLPGVTARTVSVDLSRLHERMLAFDAALTVPGGVMTEKAAAGPDGRKATTGTGDVQFNGTMALGASPSLEGALKLTNLTPASLEPWVKMQPDLTWSVPELTATLSGPVNEPRRLKVALTGSAAGLSMANVRVDSVLLDATLENGVLNLSRVDLATGGNQVLVTGAAQVAETWENFAQSDVKAQGDVKVKEIADFFAPAGDTDGQQVPGPLSGAVDGRLNATLVNGALLVRADLKGSQWVVEGVAVESVELTANTDGRHLTVDRVKAFFDPQNTVEASGTLGFDAALPLKAAWQIDMPNVERLAGWFGQEGTPGLDAGRLQGTGTAMGSLTDWQRLDFSKTTAEASLDAKSLAWKEGRMESVRLEASAEGGRVTLRDFAAVLNGNNKLTAAGGGALAAPWEFTAKVDGDLNRLADFEGWLKALGVAGPVTGKAKIAWEGGGKADDLLSLTGGGSASVEAFRIAGMTEPASLNLKTSHFGRRADISVLEGAMGDLKFSAPGTVTDKLFEIPAIKVTAGKLSPIEGRVRVPLDFTQQNGPSAPNETLDVVLHVNDWDLAEAAQAAGQKVALKGTVDAQVKISGMLSNPSAEIALTLQRISSPDIKQKLSPAGATIGLILKDRKLAAKVEVTQKPLQMLSAAASIPLDVQKLLENPDAFLTTPMEGTVTLPDSDLNGLRPLFEDIASMRGNIGMTAKVGGTIGKPSITGEFHALAPAVVFKEEDVPNARNVKLRVRFEGTRFFIEEAGAMLAGGTATARGTVDWTDAANPRIDATLTAKEALILRDETISMRADGTISCRGTLTQAAVTGRVELVRGRVFKEIEFLPLSLPNQLPPAPPAVTVNRSNAPVLPPPFDKWTLAVDIVTRDSIRLLGNVLSGGVATNLRLTGTGANPVLEGKATLHDARVRLPFTRMKISRGDIIFTKDKPFEPVLDVEGDAFINNYQVTLYAYGPALDPKLRFTSSPPLSEGEIATLLATGSTSGDLRSTQGEAANRAAFLVLSQAYRKLFRKSAKSRHDDEPPRLSFSFSLLNNSGGTRSVSAVYEISDHLQAVGAISQAGSFRGLLYYLIRFR